MRAVVQRVSEASVKIQNEVVGEISQGFLVLLGIEQLDSSEDVEWLCRKVAQMRVFEDQDGKMNDSLLDQSAEILVVSQFTLHASTKKGNRPSFTKAARPEHAEPLYEEFLAQMEKQIDKPCARGRFGADMKVALINDGPVTIIIDSKNKE